jgi:hypothetical protein
LAVNVAGLAASVNTFVMARLRDGAALRAPILWLTPKRLGEVLCLVAVVLSVWVLMIEILR